jgi:hypothetical protein
MRRSILVGIGLAALLLVGRAAAHEGHAHKVMGTLVAIDAHHVEVTTTAGAKESYPLTPETKCLKGKASANVADIKVGTRVVLSIVEKDGKKSVVEILLPSAESQKGSPDHEH